MRQTAAHGGNQRIPTQSCGGGLPASANPGERTPCLFFLTTFVMSLLLHRA